MSDDPRPTMPAIGLGTLRRHDDEARDLVERALAVGYRHIDTAQYYGNEVAVGRGIARSSVPRDQIWVTTKVLHPKVETPPDVRTAVEDSLRRLGLDHVDALLVHWPNRHAPLDVTLETFAALRDEGAAVTIGVSNFPSALLRDALAIVDDLAVNQVEYHAYLAQDAVLDVLRENDMLLTAHTPLARGQLLDDPVLTEIADGRGVSAAQVALSWLVHQDGVTAVPGGAPDHLEENLAAVDLELTQDERRAVDALARGLRLIKGSPPAPEWDA